LALDRGCYLLCRALGRLLRGATYSSVRLDDHDGERTVRKRRTGYAPLLVLLGRPLVRILDTGVRVLPQREWEERERLLYERLYGTSIRVGADGTLVLPWLAGRTLATLLEDAALGAADRTRAIELAVVALAGVHAAGFTHGDAMAENVMVDLDAGVARWFDFETLHDPSRSVAWRRADDVRALLATSLVRTSTAELAETLALIVDRYADESVIPDLATSFASVWRRALVFHLGQAPLSFAVFRLIGGLLRNRLTRPPGRTYFVAQSTLDSR
jgi:hypothetical protein